MGLKARLKEIRDDYVRRQVAQARLPVFAPSRRKRVEIIFSGRVQKVGFRLEAEEMAARLGLTGFCENLDSGDVLVQLQGEENRIKYLVSFMDSLKRIRIEKKVIKELPLREDEDGFSRR